MNRINRFSALYEKDEDDFVFPKQITHLELHPIATLIKYKDITHLEPHPTSHLIKFFSKYRYSFNRKREVRFNYYYDCDRFDIAYYLNRRKNDYTDDNEILLNIELDRLKNKIEEAKKEYDEISSKVFDFNWESNRKIREIKDICNSHCLSWLNEWHICKCGECYYCINHNGIDMSDTGRCKHIYKINNILEEMDYKEEYASDSNSKYYSLKYKYDRELAKKKGYLSEYQREQEEEWDDYCFSESQRWTDYEIYNRNPPKYVV
jgi:hypothetical protein